MQKRHLLLLLTLLCAVSLEASPKFEAGKRYHIVCQQFPSGCVVDGATLSRTTPLYYQSSANQNDESYWNMIDMGMAQLFLIQNAKTGQYVTYDGVRQDSPQLRRYVSMTDEPDGFNSIWLFEKDESGQYVIRNAEHYDQLWDVRVDSYCVGTYSNSGNGNQNQLFFFLDEEGNLVEERAPNDTGNGFDVSSWLDATTESPDGWTFDGDPWTDPGHGYYVNEDASVITPFLERWHPNEYGPLPDGSLSQQLSFLPAGNYTLSADVIAVRQSGGYGTLGQGVTLFANDQQTACSTRNERPLTYNVPVAIGQDGALNLGLSIHQTNANWVACDNFALIYHGTEEEMMEGEKEKIRHELADYLSAAEIEARITQAGNDFYALEELRKSKNTMASIDPLSRAAKDLTIDGRALVYCESLDLYLCTIPLEKFGTSFKSTVSYELREGYENLRIANREVASGETYNFLRLTGDRIFKLRFTHADGTIIEKNLSFTSLPIVKMYGSFNNDYHPGSIIVHEPDAPRPDLLNMKAKWRGGITNSNGKHKRNYHVKLLDANGEKLEKKFFGLRNDNSWILESCQVDMSRIRNRVLTDLWNDYSTPPYYIDKESKARTGSRGRFVELILNDEYRGIYCMTENMDRKQMKLMKQDEQTGTIHGQLWKSKDWSYATLMGTRPDGGYYPKDFLSDPNEYSEMWDSYQTKYPDYEDNDYRSDWQTLYDAVKFVCTSSNNVFKAQVSQYFDLPLVIDYYILMETILATDNHGKNMFFAVYDKQQDKRITFGVWDMDATSGQRWSDDYWHQSFLGPEQDYSKFIARYEHGDYNLFRRLRLTDADDFNMKVRQRYRELRQGPLATESILNRFRTQLDEFKTCGAANREYERWSYDSDVSYRQLDFDNEMEYLDDWFTRRMAYLDDVRFKIAELPDAITDLSAKGLASDVVYDLRGQRMGTTEHLDQLPPGIYLVNGRKIAVTK